MDLSINGIIHCLLDSAIVTTPQFKDLTAGNLATLLHEELNKRTWRIK